MSISAPGGTAAAGTESRTPITSPLTKHNFVPSGHAVFPIWQKKKKKKKVEKEREKKGLIKREKEKERWYGLAIINTELYNSGKRFHARSAFPVELVSQLSHRIFQHMMCSVV